MDEVFKVVNPEPTESALALGVTVRDRKAIVSSRDVARVFGKRHDHVLRDIRELDCSEEFRTPNFGETFKVVEMPNKATRKDLEIIMTKDGFIFLVMGYTGKTAAQFKEAYINEFNRMESELRGEREAHLPALVRDSVQAQLGPDILKIAREAVRAEIAKQLAEPPHARRSRPIHLIALPQVDCSVAPGLDPRTQKRLRVLSLAGQISRGVPIGVWYSEIAKAEGTAISTIYRWLGEAAKGKVTPDKAKSRFMHVTVNGIEFDIRTRAFSIEAVEWFLKEWLPNPGISINATLERLKDLAAENNWTLGGKCGLYRIKEQVAAVIGAN